jgi:methyl-accepting chemotaxis protein
MNQELSCEIRKINERLDRIAIVVQANASGAQESSALSHEMSGTASMLRAQTELFRL